MMTVQHVLLNESAIRANIGVLVFNPKSASRSTSYSQTFTAIKQPESYALHMAAMEDVLESYQFLISVSLAGWGFQDS